jgi:hypothetical protein
MALFATLALVAITFSVAGLSDPTQALGLPEGSVRAAIALSLIVIFAIISIFMYTSLASQTGPANVAAQDFAKQVFAVVGTLMTAVASFYFASRAAASAAAPQVTSPKLLSVSPTGATVTANSVVVPIQLSGTGLQLAKTVRFESGTATIVGTAVVSNDQLIKCDVTIGVEVTPAKYDVIVTTTDNATATLPKGFEVHAKADADGHG